MMSQRSILLIDARTKLRNPAEERRPAQSLQIQMGRKSCFYQSREVMMS